MLAENEYPLSASFFVVMISIKIICKERTELVKDLIERTHAQYERAWFDTKKTS
jgi:hypothetical protein